MELGKKLIFENFLGLTKFSLLTHGLDLDFKKRPNFLFENRLRFFGRIFLEFLNFQPRGDSPTFSSYNELLLDNLNYFFPFRQCTPTKNLKCELQSTIKNWLIYFWNCCQNHKHYLWKKLDGICFRKTISFAAPFLLCNTKVNNQYVWKYMLIFY